MANIYIEKVPKVEGLQFDGANGDAVVEFVGGEDYGTVTGDTVTLTPQGKGSARGQKITVERGQFVTKNVKSGVTVVNEGEFVANFSNEDGSDIASLPPAELPPPIEEDQLVYEPGFAPLSEEEKKAKEKKDKEDKEKKEKEEKPEAKPKAHHDWRK